MRTTLFCIFARYVRYTDMNMKDLIDARCGWAGTDELYVKYHDEEWGKLVSDD